jgi:uncharacterized coiled-coil DUF342 family protein
MRTCPEHGDYTDDCEPCIVRDGGTLANDRNVVADHIYITRLEREVAALRAENERLLKVTEDAAKAWTDEVAGLRAELDNTQAQHAEALQMHDAVLAQADALRADLATANARIVDEFNRRVAVEAERDRWKHDHDSRVGSWDRALAMAERAEAEVAALRRVVESHRQSINRLAQQRDDLRAERDELRRLLTPYAFSTTMEAHEWNEHERQAREACE